MARRHRGTRWSRFIFNPFGRDGPHEASRVDLGPHSPADLAPPRDRQGSGTRTPTCRPRPAPTPRRVRIAAATSRCARRCLTTLFCGRGTGRTRSAGLSFLRFMATAHSSTAGDATAHGPGGLHPDVPDGGQDLEHVGGGDLGHEPLADARQGVALETPQPDLGLPWDRARRACFCSMTVAAASAKVDMLSRRCFSAKSGS